MLYGAGVELRNIAYDKGFLNSYSFNFPIIVVGNLNVGGTGKSPQIEYLIELLSEKYKIGVLSRGYKRKSFGFQLADENSTAEQIGDEPLQFFKKFKDVIIAVDANRVSGINQLRKLNPPPDIVLLDDAFQHRKVNAGLYILLTSYGNLYSEDLVLPSGNLREKRKGAKRANIIVITKCPSNISIEEQQIILNKLKPLTSQSVFFSTVIYSDTLIGLDDELNISKLNEYKVLLVTGIANSKPLTTYLESRNIDFQHLKYSDHYNYSISDKDKIIRKFKNMQVNKKLILTTEKDYVRAFSKANKNIYYLPIQTKIITNEAGFNQEIINYVR